MSDAFTIPFPPSVNRMWRTVKGRMILSAEGRKYRTAVAVAVDTHRREVGGMPMWLGPLQVTLEAVRPDRRRRDLDNLLKGVLDAMQHAEVFDDDSQVHDLRILWAPGEPVKGGGVIVNIGRKV